MVRLLKVVFVLIVVGLAALTGYSYFGDIAPPTGEVTKPVVLDGL
ncbi:MAG: hypothetical protein U1D06_11850 [Paracoccaceae bacterium]|nr:hypothetical protein [Paracoccaceae bacterium]